MASIQILQARLAALRLWATRTFLRPDSVTLFHRPGGTADIPSDPTG